MTTVGIGRMLVASLHQAIGEHLPSRADFYAPWLHSESLRTPRVSVAGIRAALSFLRRENGAYESVVRRAGALSAEWTWQRLSGPRRAWLRMLPAALRARAACRLTRVVGVEAWRDTRVACRWRRGDGALILEQSLFCSVRAAVPDALCGFYAAALETFLRELDVEAAVRIDQCTARGDGACAIRVEAPTSAAKGPLSVTSAMLVLAVLSGLPGVGAAQSPGEDPPGPLRPVVMPFENASRDSTVSWMGEGAAILITDTLRAGGVAALTRDERIRTFERLDVPPLAALSRATVLRIGMLVGASDVVTGSIAVDGEDLVISASRLRLGAGVRDPGVTARGPKVALLDLFRRVAREMYGIPAAAADPGGPAQPAAFEYYVKGLLAETLPAQVTFLQNALKANPAYDAPRLALWDVFTSNGDHAAAREALRAVASDSALALQAQFLTSVSLVHLGRYDEAAALLKSLHSRQPAGEFLNNLGVLVLRGNQPAAGSRPASEYFGQANVLDPADGDYLYNLGYAYWREGRTQEAIRALREAVRMNPADGGAHAVLAQVLQAAGETAEAARELELAKRLSSDFDDLNLSGATGPVVPRRMARLKSALGARQHGGIDEVIASAGQEGQQDAARYYLERGRRLYEAERDREAERDLDRALYLVPYEAEAHLLLGRVFLRTGRVREAIDVLKISAWCEESVAAHVALAEAYLEVRDEAGARAELQRALTLDPEDEDALRLWERISRTMMPAAV